MAEGIIDFSGQMNTGIGLPSILTLHSENYNGDIEGGLWFKRCNKAARCFHGVFKKDTELSWCF